MQLPGAGGNQSKGQECSQGFWASGLYYAKGIGLPRVGGGEAWAGRIVGARGLGRSGEKVPGQEGWAAPLPVPGARGGKSQSLAGRLDQTQLAWAQAFWTLHSSSEGEQ